MKRWAWWLVWATAVALTAWSYTPGLHGNFLFDDWVNLTALGEFGPIRDPRTLALYLTSSPGDPLGRPLALASFLLDANHWPAAPEPFLRSNILLHLVNGQLLMLVLLGLGRRHGLTAATALRAAVGGAAFWLLHPLFLSTTLYIVQRECMLVASFALCGFLAWMRGRDHWEKGHSRRGAAWLLAGSLGCTGLAALCKANGLLIPLLLLAAEATVLPPMAAKAAMRWRTIRGLLLGAPTMLVALALLWQVPAATRHADELRPWTLAERLLTEPRVLFDYTRKLLLPNASAQTLFHDDFAVSRSLLQPATTLPALIALATLLAAAIHLRRRIPILSFGVLFFLGGHAMEGGVVALELYFEHRNYLPAAMFFWPLSVWLTQPGPGERIRNVACALLPLALALPLRLGASLWGNPEALALSWGNNQPGSARAQAYAAQVEMSQGRYEAARRRLQGALTDRDDEAQLSFNLADAECALGDLTPETAERVERAIRNSKDSGRLDFSWLTGSIEKAAAGTCQGLDLPLTERFIQAIRRNPHFSSAPGRLQDADHLDALVRLGRHRPDEALLLFDRALARLPQPATALQQAALLASAGRPDLAQCHLRGYSPRRPVTRMPWVSMQQLHNWLLDREGYWPRELERMQQQLQVDEQSLLESGAIPASTHCPEER